MDTRPLFCGGGGGGGVWPGDEATSAFQLAHLKCAFSISTVNAV